MRRYWNIYRTFFLSSLSREMEFRANFIAKIFQNLMWLTFFVLILLVLFRNTKSIAGWNQGDSFILASTCFVMNAVTGGFFFSLMDIPTQVRQGTLDFVVTKPVDSQLWVSTRRFNFDQVGSLVAGFGMLAIGVSQSGLHPGPVQWLAYFLLLLSSCALFYCFNLFLMTTGIWLVRVENLWVLGESVMQVARYPMDIYQGSVQRFFTFLLPLGFIATVPARQLVKAFDPAMVGLGVLWAVAALFLTRKFWQFAMQHYSSASS